MSGNGSGQQDVDIDLGGLFRAVWDRRVKVLLATVVCCSARFRRREDDRTGLSERDARPHRIAGA